MSTRFIAVFGIVLIALIGTGDLSAQSPAERKANRFYENFAYENAIELYEYVIRKNPENKAVIRNLAESYRKTNNPFKTEVWLTKVVESGIARNEDYLYLAQAQEENGKKEEAKKNFEKYDQLVGADQRGEKFAASLNNFSSFFSESESYRVEQLRSNSSGADFSPAFMDTSAGGTLLLVSNGFEKSYAKSVFPWNNHRWLNIYTAKLVNDSNVALVEPLPRKINSKYHEGPAAFDALTKTLAFTRNSFYKGKAKRSSDHIIKLSIYFSKLEAGKWADVKPFVHNSTEYSTGHPTFSKDGKTIYFVSDMPGGYGGSDVYMSRLDNNIWSAPENLGVTVNTEGNELFPFIYADSLLYFASNGWGGMGGVDIFRTQVKGSTAGKSENMGAPLNGPSDDFGMIVKPGGKSGYFSSNRTGGRGEDDIYRFVYTMQPTALIVVDQEDVKPLAGAKIEVYQGDILLFKKTSDAEGKADFLLKPCQKFQVVSTAEGYPNRIQEIETRCGGTGKADIRILMKRPRLYVEVFDKYKNKVIPGATVSIIDITNGNTPGGTAQTDEKGAVGFTVLPCHEYKITSSRQGSGADVSQTKKAPCTEKEETVAARLGMGIAPINGVKVKITVVDEQTGNAVPNARIRMIGKGGEPVNFLTDEAGYYETVLTEGSSAFFESSKIGYFTTSKSKTDLNVPKGEKVVAKTLKLLKLQEGGTIALEGIFYDLKKADIRPDAAKVLDYVVQVMQENPVMAIELGSHSDSRGDAASNMKLSEERAQSAAAYIVSMGIDAKRLTGKGYGETVLKNKCKDGVKCPDKLHDENRRTEIKIVDFE